MRETNYLDRVDPAVVRTPRKSLLARLRAWLFPPLGTITIDREGRTTARGTIPFYSTEFVQEGAGGGTTD